MSQKTRRLEAMSTRHMVVAGHPFAVQAGLAVLEAGGNAADAGVAVGLCINVLESEMTGFGGVAPAMVRMSATGAVDVFVGVGPWPMALDAAYFREQHGGRVPRGILDTVVPAAPDIWLTALERYGTMTFGEVAAPAIRLAREGFPMYPFMREALEGHFDEFRDMANTAAIFCPGGRLPAVGETFVQADLADTLRHLADEEAAGASRGGRRAGIDAARRAFYAGDIAAAIVRQQEAEGGLMTRDDLARFRAEIEPATRGRFAGYDVYGCGAWSQGPMVLAAAQVLDGLDLAGMGHNSPGYIHAVTEALKLSAADREAYFGDPAQIDVPLARLLDPAYSAIRRGLIDPARAFPGMPAPGRVAGIDLEPWRPDPSSGPRQPAAMALETSYFCVVDRDRNVFSATPSDPTISGDVVPGTGITTSRWGSRAHTGASHPARVGPGWRPRMSANPMLAAKPGEVLLPLGSPGSEVLGQAQLQALANMLVFGMSPQAAVEQPRFASYSWPASALPHAYAPGRLKLERDIGEATGAALADLGHDVEWWPSLEWRAGSVGAIHADLATGLLRGGADPRRSAAAAGW